MVRAMYGVQLRDRKRSAYLMFMLGLGETMLRRTLYFEVDGQRKNVSTWKRQVEDESMKNGLIREDAFC